jgi:pilus assembly protein CpaB
MSRQVTFFVFTAALALMAALLVHSALKSREAKIAALRQSTARIVVAARGLSPGETIDTTAVKLTSWPREQIPPGAFSEFQPVLGKVVKDTFGVNQPLVAAALLEPEKTGGVLPLLIPPGLRAMSIAVDDVTDMAGFVLPHARMDVLVSVALSGPGGASGTLGEVTKIVLQNIRVLAVAQTLEAGPDQPHEVKVVTLLVTPAQAERLAAASRVGTLSLAMRNFADQDQLATAGVTLPILLGLPPAEPPPQPVIQDPGRLTRPLSRRDGLKAIEVIRNGIEHQTVNFSSHCSMGSVSPPADGAAAPAPRDQDDQSTP